MSDPGSAEGGCGCATAPAASASASTGCGCSGGSAGPSDASGALERVVMELDQRVRRLEAGR